jgi:hypothetical protein
MSICRSIQYLLLSRYSCGTACCSKLERDCMRLRSSKPVMQLPVLLQRDMPLSKSHEGKAGGIVSRPFYLDWAVYNIPK